MKIGIKKEIEVDIKTVTVHAKVRDSGCYGLIDNDNCEVFTHDGYVPSFFPEEHYGDYLILEIDIETGLIKNWKAPSIDELREFTEVEE